MQLCGSLSILLHCLSLGLEWKLTFSSPVARSKQMRHFFFFFYEVWDKFGKDLPNLMQKKKKKVPHLFVVFRMNSCSLKMWFLRGWKSAGSQEVIFKEIWPLAQLLGHAFLIRISGIIHLGLISYLPDGELGERNWHLQGNQISDDERFRGVGDGEPASVRWMQMRA